MTERRDISALTAEEQSVLELCIEVEEACAELYRYFERVFDQDREFSALWEKAASEETGHAEKFRLASRLKGVGTEGIRNESETVRTLLQKILDYLERDDSVPTPVEALTLAIEVEEGLAEYHMDSVLNFSDPRLEQVFLTQLKCDSVRVALLQDALHRWKGG